MIPVKFSNSDFQLFKSECELWIKRAGLTEWEFMFVYGDIPFPSDDSIACTLADMQKMTAVIYFPETLKDCADILAFSKAELIKRSAFHEIGEVLTMPLQLDAQARTYSASVVESHVHSLIHRIYKLMGE